MTSRKERIDLLFPYALELRDHPLLYDKLVPIALRLWPNVRKETRGSYIVAAMKRLRHSRERREKEPCHPLPYALTTMEELR